MNYLHNVPRIKKSLNHLLKHDPVFSKMEFDLKDFPWEYYGPGFPNMVRIVAGQQVSTAAARSIWKKVRDGLGEVTPETILTAGFDNLRAMGMSAQKISYLQGLSEAVREGRFDPDAMENLPDDEVVKAITSLKGFGPWSAQMYLMFSLARPDIWAPGDLGIQEGMRIYLRKKERPTPEQTLKEGKRFIEHRTAASLLLWRIKK